MNAPPDMNRRPRRTESGDVQADHLRTTVRQTAVIPYSRHLDGCDGWCLSLTFDEQLVVGLGTGGACPCPGSQPTGDHGAARHLRLVTG